MQIIFEFFFSQAITTVSFSSAFSLKSYSYSILDSRCPHQICGFIHVPFTNLLLIALKSDTDLITQCMGLKGSGSKKGSYLLKN